jgi:hypothetical protein
VISDNVTRAPADASGESVALKRSSSAVIGPGAAPFGDLEEPEHVIWYSFASHDYLRDRAGQKILPPHRLDRGDLRNEDHLTSARWELLPGQPGLPARLETGEYTNGPPGRPDYLYLTRTDVRVLETTNHNGLTIPTRVTADYYFQSLRTEGAASVRSRIVQFVVTKVVTPDESKGCIPQMPAVFSVCNLNYMFADPPHAVYLYNQTNGWPDNDAWDGKYRGIVRSQERKQRTAPISNTPMDGSSPKTQ